jgi:hypothetical protein
MSTTERLGIDLVAQNKTEAAFTAFRASMQRAEAQTKQLGASSTGAFEKFTAGLQKASGLLGVTFGATAIAEFARAAVKDLADIADQADRSGLAISDLQTLTFAARQGGGDQQSIVTAFQKMNVQLEKARLGQGELGDILAANNVKLTDGAGKARDAKEIFYDIVDLVHGAANGIDRGVIATAAFGKSGQDLIPIFRDGADAIKRQEQAVRDVGGVISNEVVRKAKDFDDAWTRSWDVWTAKGKSSVVTVFSAIAESSNYYSKLFGGEQAKIDAAAYGKFMPKPIAVPAFTVTSNIEAKGNLVPRSTDLPDKDDPVKNLPKVHAIHAEIDAVKELIDQLKFENSLIGKSDLEKEISNNLRHAGAKATDAQKAAIIDLTTTMHNELESQKLISEAEKRFMEDGKKRQEQLQQLAGQTADMFANEFSAVIDGTETVGDAFANMTKNILDQMLQLGANSLFQSLLGGGPSDSGGGLLGTLFGGLFSGLYAQGGFIPAGKWGIAGESGAEPVFGPATVMPHSIFKNNDNEKPQDSIMHVNIHLAGANGDEAVARIATQAVHQGLKTFKGQMSRINLETSLRAP